jgi:hypothetical protein
MPKEFARLQSQDMGKVGAMQDLLRGIEKILPLKKEEKKETVILQSGNGNADALLKRGHMALEDGEWQKADGFFEEVLNLNAECAEAYLGKLMAELQVTTPSDLINVSQPFENLKNYQKALRFGDKSLKAELEDYRQQAAKARIYNSACALLTQGESKNICMALAQFESIPDWADSQEMMGKCREKLEQIRTEQASAYQSAEKLLTEGDLLGAGRAFARAHDYKDAVSRSYAIWGTWGSLIPSCQNIAVGLRSNGTVIAVGDNEDGQCNVSKWTDIVSITASGSHTVGLHSDGTVVAVGCNAAGQCDVSKWTNIVSISTTSGCTFGLKSDGTVIAVGNNIYGRCDVSDWTNIVAVYATMLNTYGLRSDGTVVAVGYNEDGQCNVSGWTDVIAIAANGSYTVGLHSDGTVVAVGRNISGPCDVSDWTDIMAICVGDDHTVGLRSDGTVVAAGCNAAGECNVSNWTDIVSISASHWCTIGLKSDGTVVAVGYNGDKQCNVSDWTDIVAICATWGNSFGLRSDGTVVAVGNNEYNQCNVSGWHLFDNVNTLAEDREAARRKAEQYRIEQERLAAERKIQEEKLAAERKAQEERLAMERKAQEERLAAERQARKDELLSEQNALQAELPTLKGLFAGKRRKEIERRLTEIEWELKRLK